jgi:hypothetical protein
MNASAPLLPGAGRFHSRLALCATLALTLFLASVVVPTTVRADPTPLDFSAGDQYVETLPTAKGPKATESAPRHNSGSGLSHATKQRLQAVGGSDAATLQYVASSAGLGAPVAAAAGSGQSQGGDSGKSGGSAKRGGAGTEAPSVPSAAVNAAGGSGSGLGWLALALPLITAIALGAFGFQRRRHRDSA